MLSIQNVIRYLKLDYHFAQRVRRSMYSYTDSLSKKLIEARIDYYSEFKKKYQRYIPYYEEPYLRFQRRMHNMIAPKYEIGELKTFEGRSLFVYGEGAEYEYTLNILDRSNWKSKYKAVGLSDDTVKKMKRGDVLLPACLYDFDIMASKLMALNNQIDIIRPPLKLLWECFGKQYLDVFMPEKEEYIIDCGAYNGETEAGFLYWGGDSVKKIYVFEIDPQNVDRCKRYYSKHNIVDKVVLFEKGTSFSSRQIRLETSKVGGEASRIGVGNEVAEVTSIDECNFQKVTFIKMDVEGAELDSLIGAKKTIQREKPKLAICIYHKKEDLYEIPEYILSLVPDYKITIRHYSSNPWETVLYASV